MLLCIVSPEFKHVKMGRDRAPLNEVAYRAIRERLANGEFQHDIEVDLGINQGRISEVKTRKRGETEMLRVY